MCCTADEHPEGTQVCHEIRGTFEMIKLPLCAIVHLVKRDHKVLSEFSPKKIKKKKNTTAFRDVTDLLQNCSLADIQPIVTLFCSCFKRCVLSH